MKPVFAALLLCMLAACSSAPVADKQQAQTTAAGTQWQPPKAGAVIDRYQERVTEDRLNEKYFRITVKATENSSKGEYGLKLEYGYNINETTVQLPEWTPGNILKPILKKGTEPYQCLLGFDTGDGQFHELYLIKADREQVVMKQTKGYYKQAQ